MTNEPDTARGDALGARDGSLRSFRAAAAIFALAAVYFLALFIVVLRRDQDIRSGVATYALICAAAAFGLWRRRSWGRMVGLLISVATAGLGAITLIAVLVDRGGSVVLPLIVFVLSAAMAFWLARPTFATPAVHD